MEESRNLLDVRNWPMLQKLLVGALGILLAACGIMLYANLRMAMGGLRREVQARFGTMAVAKSELVAEVLDEEFGVLHTIAANALIVEACQDANDSPRTGEELFALEETWRNADAGDELVLAIMDPQANALTAQLQRYAATLPDYVELLITDRSGVLLAAARQETADSQEQDTLGYPEHYYYANELWWESAYNNGQGSLYVGTPDAIPGNAVRPGVENRVFTLAAPIYEGLTDGQPVAIGVLRATLRISPLVEALRRGQLQSGPVALAADARGEVLFASSYALMDQRVPQSWIGREYLLNRRDHAHEADTASAPDESPFTGKWLLGHSSFMFVEVPRGDVDAALNGLDWVFYVADTQVDAYGDLRAIRAGMWLTAAATLLLSAVGVYFLTTSVSAPIAHLRDVVRQFFTSEQPVRAWTFPHHEAGEFALAFNQLLQEREDLQESLAAQSVERRREEVRRARDLELSSQIGDVTGATLDLEVMGRQVTELIRARYDLYFVGLYLVGEGRRWAVLYAGTGAAGETLLARGHRVPLGQGLVGASVASGRMRVDSEVTGETERADRDALPYTRSEAVLPLRSRGNILGALVAESYHADAFNEELLTILQIIADQIAVALDSLRLYQESQEATRRLRLAYGELSRETWQEALGGRVGMGYEAHPTGLTELVPVPPDRWDPLAYQAWERDEVIAGTVTTAGVDPDTADEGPRTQRLALPIRARNAVIGVLDVARLASHDGEEARAWTPGEIAQLEGLAQQLSQALENARLFQMARSRAQEEQLVSDVTRRIRETLNVDTVLQTALRELRSLFDLESAEIQIVPADGAGDADNLSGGDA